MNARKTLVAVEDSDAVSTPQATPHPRKAERVRCVLCDCHASKRKARLELSPIYCTMRLSFVQSLAEMNSIL